MIIGFTGTRNGMTEAQKVAVHMLLNTLRHTTTIIGLHGGCVGADADFDAICQTLGIVTHCRPCTWGAFQAETKAKMIAGPTTPMARNRAIVADAAELIATPPNGTPIRSGSGTWATIGFAKKAGKRVAIVFPDGSLTAHDPVSGEDTTP